MSTYRALWLTPELHEQLVTYCKNNKVRPGVIANKLVKDYLNQQNNKESNGDVSI
jgi:hypothetical protein